MTPLQEDLAFLEHYGVKGQRWGHRKDSTPGVSRKTDREAKKDAEEFARAKLFYGQGAGTRRKLIKATVEAKSKRDPSYAKAFDNHLGNRIFLHTLLKHALNAAALTLKSERNNELVLWRVVLLASGEHKPRLLLLQLPELLTLEVHRDKR